MGLGDFADKAKDALHSDKAEGASDKAFDKGSDKLNDATGGKFKDQVDKGRDVADKKVGDE